MRVSAPESAATSLNLFDISFAFNAIMAWDVQVSESTENKSIEHTVHMQELTRFILFYRLSINYVIGDEGIFSIPNLPRACF